MSKRATPTCPKCGSAAITYSRAKLFDGHTSKCHCGHLFDQEHAYAPATTVSVGQQVEVRTTTAEGDVWMPTKILKTYGPDATVVEIEAHEPGGRPYMYRVALRDVRPANPEDLQDPGDPVDQNA